MANAKKSRKKFFNELKAVEKIETKRTSKYISKKDKKEELEEWKKTQPEWAQYIWELDITDDIRYQKEVNRNGNY